MRLQNDKDDRDVRDAIVGALLGLILFTVGAMVWWTWIS